MALFTVRVVLHDNASWEDYDALHQRLARVGVVDVIRSDDGVWYRLPPAEYNYQGDISANDLRTAVAEIARTVRSSYAVLVTHAYARYWQGLEQIPGPNS
jgi:hypothetical protein